MADDEPVNLTLKLLREMRADMLKGFHQTVEAFEEVYEQIAEVKEDVLRCRSSAAVAAYNSYQSSDALTHLSIPTSAAL